MENTRNKRWVGIVLLAAVAAAMVYLLFGQKLLSSNSKPLVGYHAPDFSVKDLNGNTVSLSQFRGKPVILNFWASWCPPCQQETPDLVKIANEYQDRIAFVGLNLTAQDSLGDVKSFVNHYQMKYSILLDQNDQVRQLYQVEGIPTTLVINKEGKIIERAQPRALSKIELQNLVDEALR